MSGTSTDGVDAAVVRVQGGRTGPTIELVAFATVPYPDEVRELLLWLAEDNGCPRDVARANFLLGRVLAEAAREAIEHAGVRRQDVAAVGNSGHTLVHEPASGGPMAPGCTMQIGEAAVIAELLRVPVVSDFRVRDVAAGGQGAPLVAYFDYQFFSSKAVNRAVLNLGGIANVTILRARAALDDVVAFDTGPGNMPIDTAVRIASSGKHRYDKDGRLAREGRVQEELLSWMLEMEYFRRPPPKSCGRAEFGEGFVRAALERASDLSTPDLVATLTELTGRTVAEAVRAFRSEPGEPWQMVVSGGGAHNPALMASIARHAEMPVVRSDNLGIPADAKEAMAFAYLAWETLHGRPCNVPSATGAAGPRVLGKITPP